MVEEGVAVARNSPANSARNWTSYVDDANRLDARARRLGIDQVRHSPDCTQRQTSSPPTQDAEVERVMWM